MSDQRTFVAGMILKVREIMISVMALTRSAVALASLAPTAVRP